MGWIFLTIKQVLGVVGGFFAVRLVFSISGSHILRVENDAETCPQLGQSGSRFSTEGHFFFINIWWGGPQNSVRFIAAGYCGCNIKGVDGF